MEYLNVRLSNNRLEVNTPAVSAAVERTKLRYYLDIFIPKNFQSTDFERIIRLEASEVPPYRQLESMLYEGAYFPIENYLDSLLKRRPPVFNQGNVFILCESLIMPFYVVHIRMNGDEVIDAVQMPIEYVLKAGINEIDYPKWKEIIFKNKLGLAGKFLTWSIDNKVVDAGQPEFLYFLTNFLPVPSVLQLKVKKFYFDGTDSTADAYSLSGVLGYSVYSFSVGIDTLGIDTDVKEVLKYSVWVENGAGLIISEVRSYEVERRYNRNVRYILFNNSLGGFDTLRALGQGIETLKVSRQSAERYYPFGASASYSERIINQVTGERELVVRTGFLSVDELHYLQEVILAKEFYVVSDREFIPLLLISESYVSDEDDVNIRGRGREFVFNYSNRQYNYSRLVVPPSVIARSKAWRVFGAATSCYLDNHGIRTGQAVFPFLEQYYTDDDSAVVPQTVKQNIPGTEGYIASYHAAVCEDTPYLSVEVRRSVTFRHAGDCLNPYIGNYPDLVIEANTWGSEVSQAEADALAEAEWARLNTQAYADTHGVCMLMKYLNAEIRRHGIKKKADCNMGQTYMGTTAEIVIAANLFGSETSQAEADALAEAAFVAMDTQAYANEHGLCVLKPFLNAEIRRQGTKKKIDCNMGQTYVGTTAEIVIAANLFGSETSQAEADALAEAAFMAMDTQAYANEHGVCVLNIISGVRGRHYKYLISKNTREEFFDTAVAAFETNDPRIDYGYGWLNGVEGPLSLNRFMNDHDYGAARFNGLLKAPITGTVRLYIDVADDEWAALYLNNSSTKTLERVSNVMSSREVWADVQMVAGEYIPFDLKYIEFVGYNLLRLSWSYAGQAKVCVPDSAYYRFV